MSHTVFVYGTLKRGGKWRHILKHSNLISSDDSILGEMFLHEGLYPVLFSGNDEIQGEVYEVEEEDYRKAVALEKDYDVELVQTAKGKDVEVFLSKDNEAKKNLKPLKKFDAKYYFELWLQTTPEDSEGYRYWQNSIGGK